MKTQMYWLGLSAAVLVAGCSSKLDGPNVVRTSTYQPAETEKIICKKDVPTGSHIPKKTCRYESEWAELTAQAQALAREMDQRGTRVPVHDRERPRNQF